MTARIAITLVLFSANLARAQTLVVSDSWERTSNFYVDQRADVVPATYYEVDGRSWSWIANDADVWNRSAGSYRYFYTDHFGSCGSDGTHFWFRTTVGAPAGTAITGIRVADETDSSIIAVNDAAWVFVNGVPAGQSGLATPNGTARLGAATQDIAWIDDSVVVDSALVDPDSNEVAVLFEEGCGFGGLGRLAIHLELVPADSDLDGVLEDADACPGSAIGAKVDASGCSVAQLCPCDATWRNHGEYVSCVSHTSRDFVAGGFLLKAERSDLISDAAGSSCGH